jgi:SulP family sulfate permease
MDSKSTSSRTPIFSVATARIDVIAGLVSSTLAIPLAMAFGMFAFVTLGDEYFAYGAMAGLISAVIAGLVCVLLGDRSTRVYAPRITTTFFLGLLLYSLSHRAATVDAERMSRPRCWYSSPLFCSADCSRRCSG